LHTDGGQGNLGVERSRESPPVGLQALQQQQQLAASLHHHCGSRRCTRVVGLPATLRLST